MLARIDFSHWHKDKHAFFDSDGNKMAKCVTMLDVDCYQSISDECLRMTVDKELYLVEAE